MHAPASHTLKKTLRAALLATALLALAGCGDDEDARDTDAATRAGANGDAALPAPEGAVGSVTGMPANPGPGTAPIGGAAAVATAPVDGTFVLGDLEVAPATPASSPEPLTLEAIDIGTGEPVPPIIVVDAPEPGDVAPPPSPAPAASGAPTGTEAATESTTFRTEAEAPPPEDPSSGD